MTPEQVVACLPFKHITDALTPAEALAILQRRTPTRREREAEMRAHGFPAYTTSARWLGYSKEKMRGVLREAVAQGCGRIAR